MFQFVVYFAICVIISHIIIEIYTLQKQTNEKIIRQVDYIDLNSFSTLLKKQNPVCIRKANTQLPELFIDSYPENIVEYVSCVHSPVSFEHAIFEKETMNNHVYTTEYARTFFVQAKGESVLKLYPPSQKSSLYTTERNNGFMQGPLYSSLKNKEKYPLLHKAKYISVKMRESQMFFIPYNWSFSVEFEELSDSFLSVSHTLASKFLCSISI